MTDEYNMVGGNIKTFEKKIKTIEYVNKNIYQLNNMDNEKLNEFSEFPIGSITKLFTITSILLLHQNKKLNINDKIGKYIDNDNIKNIKIIDIINHKSGLKNFWDGATYGSSKIKYKSPTEIYNKWNNNKLIDDKLKGTFAYSNIGYQILGVIIEKITNENYSDYVKNNILIPLKMNNTGTDDCNITLYNYKNKKLTKYEKWERTFASSAGELKSCIKDLIKFSKFIKLLNNNTLDLLKKFYIFKENKNEINIKHNGGITGGSSELYLTYDKNWKIKNIYISLKTIS
jgi:CubicO group peptidase (beta-lactamase class C family)